MNEIHLKYFRTTFDGFLQNRFIIEPTFKSNTYIAPSLRDMSVMLDIPLDRRIVLLLPDVFRSIWL